MSCQVYRTDQTYPIANSSDLNPFPPQTSCMQTQHNHWNKQKWTASLLFLKPYLKETKIFRVITSSAVDIICTHSKGCRKSQFYTLALSQEQYLALKIIRTSWKIVETSWKKDSSPLPGSDWDVSSFLFHVFRQLVAETLANFNRSFNRSRHCYTMCSKLHCFHNKKWRPQSMSRVPEPVRLKITNIRINLPYYKG